MWKPYAPSICSSNLTGIWCFIRQSCGRELCEARVGGRHWGTAQRHPVGPSGSLPLSADCCPCRQPPPTWPRAPCWWPPLGSWMPLACPCPRFRHAAWRHFVWSSNSPSQPWCPGSSRNVEGRPIIQTIHPPYTPVPMAPLLVLSLLAHLQTPPGPDCRPAASAWLLTHCLPPPPFRIPSLG